MVEKLICIPVPLRLLVTLALVSSISVALSPILGHMTAPENKDHTVGSNEVGTPGSGEPAGGATILPDLGPTHIGNQPIGQDFVDTPVRLKAKGKIDLQTYEDKNLKASLKFW